MRSSTLFVLETLILAFSIKELCSNGLFFLFLCLELGQELRQLGLSGAELPLERLDLPVTSISGLLGRGLAILQGLQVQLNPGLFKGGSLAFAFVLYAIRLRMSSSAWR